MVQKTRVCAEWLEDLGFQTKITERRFDQNTKRMERSPLLRYVVLITHLAEHTLKMPDLTS